MKLAEIIPLVYPAADMLTNVQVQDNGNGQFIAYWDVDVLGPQPTEQDVLDQMPIVHLQYVQNQVEDNIRTLIENKPLERGYDNLMTLTSYTTSSNPQWKAEADAFIAWRDAVFAYAYQMLADVQAQLIPTPSLEDFMAGVPALTWP